MKKYDESSIKFLKGLKGVRKNPTFYMGGKETILLHMLREAIENSIDEANSGYGKEISVIVEGDQFNQTFVVCDEGRGIPVKEHPTEKISTLTLVLTELHAGGKFDSGPYAHGKRGLHGVGIACVVALSSIFEVWTYRDGNWYTQKFKEGVPITKVSKSKPPSEIVKLSKNKKGTIVRYKPDYSIIGKRTLKFSEISQSLKDYANLNAPIKFKLFYGNKVKEYQNKGGAKEFLKRLVEEKSKETLGKPFIYESKNIVCAFQWTDYDGDEGISSFVNGASTPKGGTHVEGLRQAITNSFKTVKVRGADWTASDIREGLVGFINYKCSDAEYSDQTKTELKTESAKKKVSEELEQAIKAWLKKNKRTAREVILRATEFKKAKLQIKEIRKAAAKIKKVSNKGLLPGKLLKADRGTPSEKIELFLVEGDSAGGPCKNARFKEFQEALPLRGKIINAAREQLPKVLHNNEVQNILLALGVDSRKYKKGVKHAKEDFRVGKIIILCDPDFDGMHISNLICTMLYVLVPEVFEYNMVYSVEAPLFFCNYKDVKYYADTLKELKDQLPKDAKNPNITRIKGWGEINWQNLRDIAFDPNKRKLLRILPIKGKDSVTFMKVVGDDTTIRKQLLGIEEK